MRRVETKKTLRTCRFIHSPRALERIFPIATRLPRLDFGFLLDEKRKPISIKRLFISNLAMSLGPLTVEQLIFVQSSKSQNYHLCLYLVTFVSISSLEFTFHHDEAFTDTTSPTPSPS